MIRRNWFDPPSTANRSIRWEAMTPSLSLPAVSVCQHIELKTLLYTYEIEGRC